MPLASTISEFDTVPQVPPVSKSGHPNPSTLPDEAEVGALQSILGAVELLQPELMTKAYELKIQIHNLDTMHLADDDFDLGLIENR